VTHILAHDLGTSQNKAALYRIDDCSLESAVTASYTTHHPAPGWVEQDPADWWDAVAASTRQLLSQAGVSPTDVAVVTFSGQMMGCLLVDGAGEPLGRSLIWADTRSTEPEAWMNQQVGEDLGYRITGHRLSASYSAAKALWLKWNRPELFARAARMLNAKDYMVYRLTGEFFTDYSDASSTNLLDIRRRAWSTDLTEAFGLPAALLPELRASAEVVGSVSAEAAAATGLAQGTPVAMGGGDGSCACVGAGVVEPGRAYNVIGTSSWISLAAREPHFDPARRTFNWVHLDPALVTPCGTMQAAGFSYGWYHDTFFPGVDDAVLAAHIDAARPGAGGVVFLPYLLGERSPLWDLNARGAFIGMGAATSAADMTRAVFEGIGYNLRLILEILDQASPIAAVRMIGGAARNRSWTQMLADIWDRPLELLADVETATSRGAAVAGGISVGAYPDYSVAAEFAQVSRRVAPIAGRHGHYEVPFARFRESYSLLAPIFGKLAVDAAARKEGGKLT
jgi:xylulokinase